MKLYKKKVKHFVVYYPSESEFEELYKEIFVDQQYHFNTNNKQPFIIDCGANIGFATLYFKLKYPTSKIICFEPNPYLFPILSKNITANNLKDVTLINGAVTNKAMQTFLYFEMQNNDFDSLGASTIKSWGSRKKPLKLPVKSYCLSNYVNSPIDYLKLDVEGAEFSVIKELGAKLKLINEIFIEYHQTLAIQKEHYLENLLISLFNNKFNFEVEHKSDYFFLSKKWHSWFTSEKPHLAIIHAKKILDTNVSIEQKTLQPNHDLVNNA